MSTTDKIQLSGGPDKTVTWIWLDPVGGQLKVEYYDFSSYFGIKQWLEENGIGFRIERECWA